MRELIQTSVIAIVVCVFVAVLGAIAWGIYDAMRWNRASGRRDRKFVTRFNALFARPNTKPGRVQ